MEHTTVTSPPTEPQTPEEVQRLADLEADEAYWDYLDELEFRYGGAREWDRPVTYGAAR